MIRRLLMILAGVVLSTTMPAMLRADKPTLEQLWTQQAQLRRESVVDHFRTGRPFRTNQRLEILKQIRNQAPKESVDALRAQVESLLTLKPYLSDIDFYAKWNQLLAPWADKVEKDADAKDLLRPAGLLYSTTKGLKSLRGVALDFSATAKLEAFLLKHFKSGGDQTPEASYWLAKAALAEKKKEYFQAVVGKFPTSPFALYAQLQTTAIATPGKLVLDSAKYQDIANSAVALKKPLGDKVAYLAQNAAGLANNKFQALETTPLKYPQHDLFPFENSGLEFSSLAWLENHPKSNKINIGSDVDFAKYYSLYPQQLFANNMKAFWIFVETNPSKTLEKDFEKFFDKVEQSAKKDDKAIAALAKARFFWTIERGKPSTQFKTTLEACNHIVDTYQKSTAVHEARDLLGIVNFQMRKTEPTQLNWTTVGKKGTPEPLRSVVSYNLATIVTDPKGRISAYQDLVDGQATDPIIKCCAYYQMGVLCYQTGDLKSSFKHFDHVVKNWPVSFDLLILDNVLAAPAYTSVIDRQKAARIVAEWKPFVDGDLADWKSWAVVGQQRDSFHRTYHWNEFIRKHDKSPLINQARLQLGFDYEKLGKLSKARENYRAVLSASPKPIDALLARLGIVRTGGIFDGAYDEIPKKKREEIATFTKDLSSEDFIKETVALEELEKLGPLGRLYLEPLVDKNAELTKVAVAAILKASAPELIDRALEKFRTDSLDAYKKSKTLDDSTANLLWACQRQALEKDPAKKSKNWCLLSAQTTLVTPDKPAGQTVVHRVDDKDFPRVLSLTDAEAHQLYTFAGLKNIRQLKGRVSFQHLPVLQLDPVASPRFAQASDKMEPFSKTLLTQLIWAEPYRHQFSTKKGENALQPAFVLEKVVLDDKDTAQAVVTKLNDDAKPLSRPMVKTFKREGETWKPVAK